VTLVLLAPFLAPGAVMLVEAQRAGLLPSWLAGSLVWEHIMVPHQAWALLVLCVWLIVMRARAGDERGGKVPVAHPHAPHV
jgi:hypothetical protein